MDRRIFFLLNMAQKRLFRHVDAACESSVNASVTQMAALMMVAKQPGLQQKDLAAALELNKSAITGLVARMEKNGLITRNGLDADGRAVCLSATAGGLEKIRQFRPLISMLNDELAAEFSEDELTTVLRFLNFIINRF